MSHRRGRDMDEQMPFELFTVSEKTEPMTGSAGSSSCPTTPSIRAAAQGRRRTRATRIAGAARVAAQRCRRQPT
jgi:hypothetical protein